MGLFERLVLPLSDAPAAVSQPCAKPIALPFPWNVSSPAMAHRTRTHPQGVSPTCALGFDEQAITSPRSIRCFVECISPGIAT